MNSQWQPPKQEERPGMIESVGKAFVKITMWILMGVILWAIIVAVAVGTWRAVRG